MTHSVRRHLRVEIEAYDRSIRAFIPSYEEMLERTARAVAESRPRRVIDLGAGTGALAEAVLRRCEGPRWSSSTPTPRCSTRPGNGSRPSLHA